jgi:TFIIH p62 subunit, N-terminal domain
VSITTYAVNFTDRQSHFSHQNCKNQPFSQRLVQLREDPLLQPQAMSGPMRPPLNEGETQSLQFPAIYKKCLGVAFLSNQRVLWMATDAQSKAQKVELAWAAVKDHMVRQEHSKRLML